MSKSSKQQPESSEDKYFELLDEMLREHSLPQLSKEEQRKLSSPHKAESMRRTLSHKQYCLAVESDDFVSVMCPRRSGKSYAILVACMASCIEIPGFRVAIFCLSKPHAAGIYWEDMHTLNKDYSLGCKSNGTSLTFRFPNDSMMVLCGAESEAEVSKVRGRKYHRVVIDEAMVYRRDLFHMLTDVVVPPALLDYGGALWLSGTPEGPCEGDFYEATCAPPKTIEAEDGTEQVSNWQHGQEKPAIPYRWKFHTWTSKENTKMPHIWETALKRKKRFGWADDNPIWRREYLGQWVETNDLNTFMVSRDVNCYGANAPDFTDGFEFIMGADFGFHDGTALVIWAFKRTEPEVYEFMSIKRREITEQQIAQMIRDAESSLPKPVLARVGDPGGGGVIIMEGLQRTYGLTFIRAEKHNKIEYINQFNRAATSGLVWLNPSSPLVDEMSAILWNKKTMGTTRQSEDRRFPNDLSDAAIYSFRYAKNRHIESNAPVAKPKRMTLDEREEAIFRGETVGPKYNYDDPLGLLAQLKDKDDE
ncbi:MAG: hypothetical protein IPL79_20175 [Myxococcales bacterium]|nr:hypothetical protein [Myxococcales bacterium]